MNKPFRLVSWDAPFLQHLRDEVYRATADQPGRAIVVFPHDRPRRYFLPLFHTPGTPCLPPRLFTITELMTSLRRDRDARTQQSGTPVPVLREATLLDQVALLHGCVERLRIADAEFSAELSTVSPGDAADQAYSSEARQGLRPLATLSEARFFPWGVRLAGVFEECFAAAVAPDDLTHVGDEAEPFAAALLGALGRLFRLYRAALDSHGLTTAGLDAFTATENLERDDELPDLLAGKQVLLAGFNALSGTEERLFRHLWRHGAVVCLHGHPRLAAGERPAGCTALADWIQHWSAPCELVNTPSGAEPVMHFFAGHDLHSQIAALREDLDAVPGLFATPHPLPDSPDSAASSEADQTPALAVALTHADALLPVLHHLPARNCNVSLGYPLHLSLLSRLIQNVLELRTSRPDINTGTGDLSSSATGNGTGSAPGVSPKVHWRAWSALLRHPYLRLLQPEGRELREALHSLEQLTRQGTRFCDPYEHLASVRGTVPPETAALLDALFHALLDVWAQARTPADMAEALGSLCRLLLERGAHLWPRFPLDAECLFRLLRRVVPALGHNLMAQRALPWSLLQSMLTSLLEAERVPFEADPLTGVQVLGMLETRLLHFEHVYLLDVVEAHLPGPPEHNPLLPDSLRRVLGLPGTRQRDELAAYTFHRLIAGARHVYLYWQEDDAGMQRSRLAEACVWREEQRRGRLLDAGEPPLRAPRLRVTPPEGRLRPVERNSEIETRMAALLRRPLSPTTLDAYLTCPLRFYYERLCGLREALEVNEGDDAPAVGILVHDTLQEFYTPWLGRYFRPDSTAEQTLQKLFLTKLAAMNLESTLPPESAALLRVIGPERLRRFLSNQPEEPLILHLEHKLTAAFPVNGHTLTLTGTLDRVDQRTHELNVEILRETLILDYKTGAVRLPANEFWKREDLFHQLNEAVHSQRPPQSDDPLFAELTRRLPSLQLPFYLLLYREAMGETAHNAAGVELGEHGTERPLFSPKLTGADRQFARETAIPALISFVLDHMIRCDTFFPREGQHCHWCSVNKLCRI